MRELPHLVQLQAFEAAARHLSFTRAAEELNCTQAAISQRVRGLEQYFGRPLFHRRASGLELSSAGKAFLPGIMQALDIAEAATRGLTGRRLHQSLTISAPISFLNLWLGPRLPGFLAQHRGVAVQLNSAIWTDPNSELADLSFGVMDAAYLPPEAVVLARETLVLVGGPQHSGQLDVDELPQIEVQGRHSLWDIWSERTHRSRRPRLPPIRVDNALSAIELAASGAGVTVIYGTYAQRPLAEGRLVAPMGDGVPVPLVLVMSRNLMRKETAAVRDFMAWVSGHFPAVEGQVRDPGQGRGLR